MVSRLTSKPAIKFLFYTEFVVLEVHAKGKLLSANVTINPDIWPLGVYSKLVDCWKRFEYIAKLRHELLINSGLGTESNAGYVSFMARYALAEKNEDAARNELNSLRREMVTPAFIKWIVSADPIQLKVGPTDKDDRGYALYQGGIWSCVRHLEVEQWQLLIQRFIERENAELAVALAGRIDSSTDRERLSAEVRRAVWIRDKGKCAKCDSRERLEYDHIVPLSRGGSNTERNIELLCEVCNRAKSDAIM
jgi:hypothetical protein